MEGGGHQFRSLPHGRPAQGSVQPSRRRDRRHLRRQAGAHAGRDREFRHRRRPRLHRSGKMPRRDEARSRHPLPGDRRACGLGRARRSGGRQHPDGKALRGFDRRCRPHDRGGAKDRQAPGHQLAARLVPLAQHDQAPDRRRRDRRRDRGAFLRRQPRPALPSRRQGRSHRRGGPEGQAQLLVLQDARPAAAACSTMSATASRSAPGS